jgi:hypothetical protein
MSLLYPNEAGGSWLEEDGLIEYEVEWEHLYEEGIQIRVFDGDNRDVTHQLYNGARLKLIDKAWDLYHAGDY